MTTALTDVLVRLLRQVVLGDRDAVGARRKIEVDGAVEPAGAQQRRVEAVGAVGGGEDQDVGRLRPAVAVHAPWPEAATG